MSTLEIICDRPSPYRRDKFANRLIDYSNEDLFKGWSEEELISCLNACLNTQPINLELSTLIWKKLYDLGKNHELAKEKIRQKGKKIITWLPGARYRVGHLMNNFKYTGKVRGSYKVYFILLNEYNKRPPMWGLYIGQTGKKIEDRYEQHLDPDSQLRSRKVTKRGTQILYSLCNLVPPMNKKDSLGVELLLLKSFRGESTEKLIRKLPKDSVRGG